MRTDSPHLSHPLLTLPDPLPEGTGFLPPGTSPARLIEVAAANHEAWFSDKARVSGGEVRLTNGVLWTRQGSEVTIAFPRMPDFAAGRTLDEILSHCFGGDVGQVGCWSLTPTRPRDLGARLAARGFEWGWRPHWMALDLNRAQPEFTVPHDLRIAVNDGADWDVSDLPYYSPADAAVLLALSRETPRRVWHIGAWLGDRVVGQSVLYVTTGKRGVAGIYNVGVVPSARNQGIGKAVSLAACQFARALGANYALLNSAADHIYTRLGFESLGYGQTWWAHRAVLAGSPPSPAQVAFAEAIGRGDTAMLDTLPPAALPDNLNDPLSNGMTPMALAVQARKPLSAEWLLSRGATLDILQAYDLGWKARARQLIRDSPELLHRRIGPWQITPLHEAVQRNDIALARLLLTGNPDLDATDSQFNGTPVSWARVLHRTEILALLEQARG